MENQKASSFVFSIIAIILGVVLYKQFDFEKLTFEKPTLAVLYIIVFLFSVFILIKNAKKGSAK
ncbi:hypothetical protein B0A80_14650 [Flavobacterium tructae]|uniref:hypothetical protein n=1 Tax=Flavobacterium tructae TaxID=1114873 RepID=UPI000B5BB379|nr:hypothetical protein [Flavobacterium tructae]OXB22737.1 hypothetical protein B0A80_14650 [Flavobacterium tructae]